MEEAVIIRKIKGLLAKAEDHANDEECQSALVMAKRWMVKYHIKPTDLVNQEMSEQLIRTFEQFEWWEELLGALIAEEFRVRAFYRLSHNEGTSTALFYYGLHKDLDYAHTIFNLAYEGMGHFAHLNQKQMAHLAKDEQKQGLNDYISGFLRGLQEKFKAQTHQFQAIASNELTLVLGVPKQVKEQFRLKSQTYKANCLELPEVKNLSLYQKGWKDSENLVLDLNPKLDGEML